MPFTDQRQDGPVLSFHGEPLALRLSLALASKSVSERLH
jgi:hypothetical protein